jgi:hypothetical protein
MRGRNKAGCSGTLGQHFFPAIPPASQLFVFVESVSQSATILLRPLKRTVAAEVLGSYAGSDAFGASYTRPAHSMTIEPRLPSSDVTLSWPTFGDAAAQAGISRVYGGIHFDDSNLAGQDLGRTVGARVLNKARGGVLARQGVSRRGLRSLPCLLLAGSRARRTVPC